MDGHNLNNSSARNSQRRQLCFSENHENSSSDNYNKKMTHSDIEKQRRQEMSSLHASLRSLLPLEYIKGKRSISDHINETATYVKDLKNKIEELSAKRDELKKLSNLSISGPGSGSTKKGLPCVMIHPCLGGLEIAIRSNFSEQGMPLSRVLQVLLKGGLDVVSCVSTKVNHMLLLTIHIQASDLTCIDLSELQLNLIEVIIPLINRK